MQPRTPPPEPPEVLLEPRLQLGERLKFSLNCFACDPALMSVHYGPRYTPNNPWKDGSLSPLPSQGFFPDNEGRFSLLLRGLRVRVVWHKMLRVKPIETVNVTQPDNMLSTDNSWRAVSGAWL